MLETRPAYYPGKQWAEHIREVLLRDEDWTPQDEWGVDLDSSDSCNFDRFTQEIASQSVLVYWPLVMVLTQTTIHVDRQLTCALPEPLRDLVCLYLIPDAEEIRDARVRVK
jgi:hypothetical protein